MLTVLATFLSESTIKDSSMKKSVLISLPSLLLACLFSITQAAEEQIVIDDLSPAQLRAEIEKIQREVYRVFNALNTDDNMDIICADYMPTGSNIRREACEPKFLTDGRAKNVSDWKNQSDLLLTPAQLERDLLNEFAALTAAMNAVAETNLYFEELTTILRVLNERLEE